MVELLKVVWGVCVCAQEQGCKAGVCKTEQSVLSLSVSLACVVCSACQSFMVIKVWKLWATAAFPPLQCACAITTSDLWILPFPARHPAQAWKEGQWYKTRAKLYWISSLLSKTSISEHVLHPTETSPEHKVQNRKGTKLSGGSEPTEITGGVRGWNVVLVTGWSRHRNGLRK